MRTKYNKNPASGSANTDAYLENQIRMKWTESVNATRIDAQCLLNL